MAEILPSSAPSSVAVFPERGRRPASVVALLVSIGLLLVLLFGRLFGPVVNAWQVDPNYSHGYLIPIICIFLAVRSRNKAGSPLAGDTRFALLSLIPGAVVLMIATIVPWPLITFGAFALCLRVVAVAVGGRAWARHFTAPILFTFFMFPVPVVWTSTLALWLQDIVTRLSAGLMDPFVICIRKGTMLHFVGVAQPLQVGEQCSGLRQLVGFLAFAVLLGLLLDRPTWWRIVLVVLAIPFAVLANVLRVMLMCFGAIKFGTGWMDGWLHHAPAAFTLPMGFGMMMAVDYVLSRCVTRNTPANSLAPIPSRPSARGSALTAVVVCLAIVLMCQRVLIGHLASAGAESFPSMSASLAEIPRTLADGWVGSDHPGLNNLRATLPYTADDMVMREYQLLSGGPTLQLFAVHSLIGDDRKHHPEICIREVTGAPEDLSARARVPVDPQGERQVQKFVFRTGIVGRMTVYYWHYTLVPGSEGQTFVQTLHQRLGQTPPSVTVQVSTSSTDPEQLRAIETSFLPQVDTIMREKLLPSSAVIDTTRLPVTLLRE